MGKFCKKCGSPIDPSTNLCPVCDIKSENKNKNAEINKVAVITASASITILIIISVIFCLFKFDVIKKEKELPPHSSPIVSERDNENNTSKTESTKPDKGDIRQTTAGSTQQTTSKTTQAATVVSSTAASPDNRELKDSDIKRLYLEASDFYINWLDPIYFGAYDKNETLTPAFANGNKYYRVLPSAKYPTEAELIKGCKKYFSEEIYMDLIKDHYYTYNGKFYVCPEQYGSAGTIVRFELNISSYTPGKEYAFTLTEHLTSNLPHEQDFYSIGKPIKFRLVYKNNRWVFHDNFKYALGHAEDPWIN